MVIKYAYKFVNGIERPAGSDYHRWVEEVLDRFGKNGRRVIDPIVIQQPDAPEILVTANIGGMRILLEQATVT